MSLRDQRLFYRALLDPACPVGELVERLVGLTRAELGYLEVADAGLRSAYARTGSTLDQVRASISSHIVVVRLQSHFRRAATATRTCQAATRLTQGGRARPADTVMPHDLLAYFSADFTEADVEALHSLVERLASQGPWSRAVPEFIDETDDSSCSQPEDEPTRTVALLLVVSSRGEDPSTPVDEAARAIDALARFSAERGVEFELQIDQTHVGDIVKGVADEDIRVGLLEKW